MCVLELSRLLEAEVHHGSMRGVTWDFQIVLVPRCFFRMSVSSLLELLIFFSNNSGIGLVYKMAEVEE